MHACSLQKLRASDLVRPLLRHASSLLERYGKAHKPLIADSQYYSAEVFKTIKDRS